MTLSMTAPASGTMTLHCQGGIGDRVGTHDRQRVGQGHARHHLDGAAGESARRKATRS
jgi:hypothetical protein